MLLLVGQWTGYRGWMEKMKAKVMIEARKGRGWKQGRKMGRIGRRRGTGKRWGRSRR